MAPFGGRPAYILGMNTTASTAACLALNDPALCALVVKAKRLAPANTSVWVDRESRTVRLAVSGVSFEIGSLAELDSVLEALNSSETGVTK